MRLSALPPAHHLPTDVTPFVRRERELAEIAVRLWEPDVRLVTLVGVGRMGKTSLALEVARTACCPFIKQP